VSVDDLLTIAAVVCPCREAAPLSRLSVRRTGTWPCDNSDEAVCAALLTPTAAAAMDTAAAVDDDDNFLEESVCNCLPCDADERALLDAVSSDLLLKAGAADVGRDAADTEVAALSRALPVPALAVLTGRREVSPTATLPCRTGRCTELLEGRDVDVLAFCLPAEELR
jgi:hypothetical protein